MSPVNAIFMSQQPAADRHNGQKNKLHNLQRTER